MIVWSPAPLSASSVMRVCRLSCQRPFTPAFARTLVQTVLRVVTWRVGSVGCGEPNGKTIDGDASVSIPAILAGQCDDGPGQRVFVVPLGRMVALRAAW